MKIENPERRISPLSATDPNVLAQARRMGAVSAVGSADSVEAQLRGMIDTYHPDERMLTGMIHDIDARMRSFSILADVLRNITGA